ncbi:MAG: hypothetical protein IKO20_04855 [Bacteroidaceae bacterium]|nr:hypothetical protein [Bacteroidaceae bacterium]
MLLRRLFIAMTASLLTAAIASAQIQVIPEDNPIPASELTNGTYIIYATTAGATGYIYNATTSTGENFRVSTASHPAIFAQGEYIDARYCWDLTKSGDGTFTLRNLSTGNYLPADHSRNLNCNSDTEAASLLTDESGVLWQTNNDYHGEVLYLHTNYRSDDRCLSYWNDADNPGEGTALRVEFYPCQTEELFNVNTSSGTFYRKNRWTESTETSNSVYKYVSKGTSPQLTIVSEGPVNNIVVPNFDWYCGSSLSQTYTISISQGHRITGYEIIFTNGDTNVPMTITPAEGGLPTTAQGSEEAYLSVTDLQNQSTSFTITASEHKPAHISSFIVYYEAPHQATFELYDADKLVMTSVTEAFEGDDLSLPTDITALPYARLHWDSGRQMRGEDMTVRVDYEWDGPFEIGGSYFVCIGDTIDETGNRSVWGPLSYIDASHYDGTRFDLALCETGGCETTLGHPKNLNSADGVWKFEGNAWDGFSISHIADGRLWASATAEPGTNTGLGITVQLVTPEEAEAQNLHTLWDVVPAKGQNIEGGFFLRQHGSSYSLNERQNGSRFFLAYWTGGESTGSTFRINRTLPERSTLRVSGVAYSTSYYPFSTQIPATADLKAYTAQLADDHSSIELHEIKDGIIPASEPVLLIGNDNSPLQLSNSHIITDLAPNNVLTGTADTLQIEASERSNYLVLSWMLRTGFFTSNTLSIIPAHTAYIDARAVGSTRGLPIGAITAIATLREAKPSVNTPTYDLQGRRVSTPTRGIYIIQGRKVFIK